MRRSHFTLNKSNRKKLYDKKLKKNIYYKKI